MRYWVLTAMAVIASLLQTVAASYFAINNILPNFLLVVVVTLGLLFGWQVGLGAGVLGGFLIDLTSGGLLVGVHVLSLGTVGLASGLVEERIFKDNLLLGPVAVVIGTVLSQTIQSLCLQLFGWQVPFLGTFGRTILWSAAYNMVWAFFVYGQVYKHYHYLRPNPRGTIVMRRH